MRGAGGERLGRGLKVFNFDSSIATASDIGGAIETSPLFLVKRIRALIAGASPDIMLIAYRSSIFMPPPVGERRARGEETTRLEISARRLREKSGGYTIYRSSP